jgi:hypothetical protein
MDDIAISSEYTQEDRAERIADAVENYRKRYDKSASDDEVLTDFLVDLMHYFAVNVEGGPDGFTFQDALVDAEMHFAAESPDDADKIIAHPPIFPVRGIDTDQAEADEYRNG